MIKISCRFFRSLAAVKEGAEKDAAANDVNLKVEGLTALAVACRHGNTKAVDTFLSCARTFDATRDANDHHMKLDINCKDDAG